MGDATQHKPSASDETTAALDFWLACTAFVAVAVLQYFLVNDLIFGPRWMAPVAEIALFIPLAAAFRINQRRAKKVAGGQSADDILRDRRIIRQLAFLLTAVMSLFNLGALFEVVRALAAGAPENGRTLLLDAVNIWVINIILFALWFWGVDGGGPAKREVEGKTAFEFLFPQAQATGLIGKPFTPGFLDYLFLSFTNATAFSPTDTLPLTHRAKLLMMAEAMISLLTIAFVAARAVSILQ